MEKTCPKCGHISRVSGHEEIDSCQKCGLIFAKYRPPSPAIKSPASKSGLNDPVDPKVFIILGLFALVFFGYSSIKYFKDKPFKMSGFATVAEFEKAKKKGFTTKSAMDSFLAEKRRKEEEESRARKEKEKREFEECRKDLKCLAESKSLFAAFNCTDPIEKMAKYSFEWTDGWVDSKFTHYRWKDQRAGVVTYIGDKIKFQNGFGAYQYHRYECDIDAINDRVIAVRAQPGRL